MTNYFIIHGLNGKPFESWFPWLENKISRNNLQCIAPQFPTPMQQNYSNWEKLLNFYREIGYVHEDTFFITHSLGSIFIIKYILLNKINIKGLITVAGFNNFISGMDEFDNINKSFFLENSEIQKINKYVKKIYSFYSKNDPNLPFENQDKFAKLLGSEIYIIPDGGHFNSAAGYNKFEDLYEIIKSSEF